VTPESPGRIRARAAATLAAALACPHRAGLPPGPGHCPACPPEALCSLGRGKRNGVVNLTECCQCIVDPIRSNDR
jgi:hypothetical protein